jgi:hypothetical protein
MTNLTEKAMLVRLGISMWTARRFDKEISEEVAEIHGTAREAGRFNKLLLPKTALQPLQAAATALRGHHERETLPWSLTGVALLPSANYFAYMGEHRRLRIMFDDERARFLTAYESAKAQAKRDLADMYREDDYPEVDALAGRIGVNLDVMPMPEAADFRVSLGSEEEARIRDSIERSVNASIEAAVRSLWERVHETVTAMHDRLSAYQRDPKTGRISNPFRDSLVSNLRELVDLMGRLNVTDDPQLEAVRRRLADKLCEHEPEALREDDALRARQAAECRAILDSMGGYIGAPVAVQAAA